MHAFSRIVTFETERHKIADAPRGRKWKEDRIAYIIGLFSGIPGRRGNLAGVSTILSITIR